VKIGDTVVSKDYHINGLPPGTPFVVIDINQSGGCLLYNSNMIEGHDGNTFKHYPECEGDKCWWTPDRLLSVVKLVTKKGVYFTGVDDII
jgi:hypothetical protein